MIEWWLQFEHNVSQFIISVFQKKYVQAIFLSLFAALVLRSFYDAYVIMTSDWEIVSDGMQNYWRWKRVTFVFVVVFSVLIATYRILFRKKQKNNWER